MPAPADPDWSVREAAIAALARGGGSREALLAGLDDPHHQVRAAALDAIDRSLARGDGPALAAALARSRDPWDRARLARMLGVLGTDADTARRALVDAEELEREAWWLALARAGERDARRWFARRLQTSTDEERGYALGDVFYLARRLPDEPPSLERVGWLAAALSPLLLDRSPVAYVGPPRRPGEAETVRACDVAVRTLVETTGQRFSFDPHAVRHLPDAALAEVARWIRPVAAEHRYLFDGEEQSPSP